MDFGSIGQNFTDIGNFILTADQNRKMFHLQRDYQGEIIKIEKEKLALAQKQQEDANQYAKLQAEKEADAKKSAATVQSLWDELGMSQSKLYSGADQNSQLLAQISQGKVSDIPDTTASAIPTWLYLAGAALLAWAVIK